MTTLVFFFSDSRENSLTVFYTNLQEFPRGGDGGGSEWIPELTTRFPLMILWLPWVLVVGLIIAFYIFWQKHKKVLDRLSGSSYNDPTKPVDPQEVSELPEEIGSNDFFIEESFVLQQRQKELEELKAKWAKKAQENDLRPRRK